MRVFIETKTHCGTPSSDLVICSSDYDKRMELFGCYGDTSEQSRKLVLEDSIKLRNELNKLIEQESK
ncbi:hypothetical protein C4577_03095 [Candidatus Parcubacteria bacterium]|nr:MAG: hypothetical protein C4577_03095 [Candidatus Parcubacteria bacterium]